MSNEFDNAWPAEDFKKARRGKAPLALAANADRFPPHSIEAEQGVLGCILLSPAECLGVCVEKLKSGSMTFYDLRHREIYGALLGMQDAGMSIDLITLRQFLSDRQQLEPVGGLAYLSELQDKTPSAANLDNYVAIVREKLTLRKIIGACTDIVMRAYEHQGDVEKLLDTVEWNLSSLTEAEMQGGGVHMREVLKRILPELEKHYARGSQQLNGLPTGPKGVYLDKLLGGIAPTDYVVLAGRPGSGKTSFAVNILEHVSADYEWWEETGEFHPLEAGEEETRPVMRQRRGVPVCIFSIEMTADSLVMRMLFSRAKVDLAQWMQGYRHKDDQAKLIKAYADLAKAGIYIDDCPEQSIGQIAAKARRYQKQFGVKLFVLDYLQLVEHDGGNGMDRVKELTKISRKIMALKKQLKVPWLVLAQMNRDIEKTDRGVERKPRMSDLADSGAIEKDCDVLMFTHKTSRRDVEKNPGDDESKPSDKQIIEALKKKHDWAWSMVPSRVDIIIAKHRDGPIGEAQQVFLNNLCRFEDWHQWKVKHGVEETNKGEARPDGEEVL